MVFVHFRSSVLFPLGLIWGFLGLGLGALGVWQASRTQALLQGAWRVEAPVVEKIAASGQQYAWRVRFQLPDKRLVEAKVSREEFDSFAKGARVQVVVSADGRQAWLASGGGPGYSTALALMGLAAFAMVIAMLFMLVAWRRAVARVARIEEMKDEPSIPPEPMPETTPPD